MSILSSKDLIIKTALTCSLMFAASGVFAQAAAPNCGDGFLQVSEGEECDLGDNNDGALFNAAGNYSDPGVGCTNDCKVKNVENWDCSDAAGGQAGADKGQSFDDMTTASNSTTVDQLVETGSMLELYDFLAKSNGQTTTTGTLNTSIATPSAAGCASQVTPDENCTNYQKALYRFKSMNLTSKVNDLAANTCTTLSFVAGIQGDSAFSVICQ